MVGPDELKGLSSSLLCFSHSHPNPRHQLKELFKPITSPFPAPNAIYSSLQAPQSGNRTRKAWAELGAALSVLTPGSTQSISNSRFTPSRAVLPRKGEQEAMDVQAWWVTTSAMHAHWTSKHLWTHQRHHTLGRLPQPHISLLVAATFLSHDDDEGYQPLDTLSQDLATAGAGSDFPAWVSTNQAQPQGKVNSSSGHFTWCTEVFYRHQ